MWSYLKGTRGHFPKPPLWLGCGDWKHFGQLSLAPVNQRRGRDGRKVCIHSGREHGNLYTEAGASASLGDRSKEKVKVLINTSLAVFGGKASQGLRSPGASLLSSSRCAPVHYEGGSDSPDLLKLRGAVPLHSGTVNPEHSTLHFRDSVPGMGC